MEIHGQWKKYALLLFNLMVFNITLSQELSSGSRVSVSRKKQFADIVLWQQTIPNWYYTSIDAVPTPSKVFLPSHNRQQKQMEFPKTVHFEVKEDTIPGTVVGKLETEFETLTPITYSVQEDDGENLFLLSPLSGEFLLSRSLDFETQSFYILTVALEQRDLHVSSVRLYINVLDVNDNPPVFSQDTYSALVLEDTRVGTCLLSLNVSDKDDADNGDLRLRLVWGDEEDVFFINPSGILCLNTELDREKQTVYNLTVTANDCGQPESSQFTSTAHVIVVVADVNDNAPLFVSATIISIPEDAPLHSVVTTVLAQDEDTGSNGEVLYYLNSTSDEMFSINTENGKIYLEKELDREKEDTLYITLTATDKGSPRMAAALDLRISVEDANDHDPEFSQSFYSLTMREDIPRGSSLIQVEAVDRDIGRNGQVRYILTPASPFVVDSVRGVVTVMDKLDREKDSAYTLVIRAVDGGDIPKSAAAVMSVTLLDINDFTPVFTPETLLIHAMENEEDPTHQTHQVTALDEDVGINSQLTYSILEGEGDGLFSITANGSFQIVQTLDRERESLYCLIIIAVDSGLPPLTGTLTAHVVVEDVNDNHPEFTEEAYNTIVSEDSPTGTVFAMIMASDPDEGLSGEIRYSLEKTDVPFAIDETSGELFTTDILDRETEAVYRVMVISNDRHPTQPRSSSVIVTVILGDINDHWPQFINSPYVAYMPNEMMPGSVVCALRATDGDTGMNAELQYLLYGPNSDLFSIHPFSGVVFTSSTLQRTEDIVVYVHVEDAGDYPKSENTSISIRFRDKSEFPKMNVDVLRYSLSEDQPVGTLVGVVSGESIRTEPVNFYLASGNFEDTFHVEQLSGVLTVKNPLDYESKREFTLLVEARDSGSPPFSSFAEIHMNISDVNDNYPQFTQAEYRCEVFENSPPSWVCDVLTIDADSSSYSLVQYNITEGNTYHFFTIDPENGLLSTTVSLDRENTPKFDLTIEAVELDDPRHKDKATVIIVVLDRNDNAPRFSQVFYTKVPEDFLVGQIILNVTTTDDDTGVNAEVNYTIVNQTDDIPFSIDFRAGSISIERPLDRETQSHYILQVNANDSAWSTSTDVTIIIADVNDNRPVFSDHFYTVVLPEATDKEVFVMQVLATDADVRPNSEIVYFIESPNEEFWMNFSSGEIYTKQPVVLHNSAFEVYQFTVIAYDCGTVPLFSNATVAVRIEPYNHHPPMFLPFQTLIPVPYDMTVGTEVVQLTAIDQDVKNSSVGTEYGLNGGNASDFFWIQAESGKVTLIQSLEESLNLFLTLLVMAKDQGYPSLSTQADITFEITGKNLFSPRFREPNATLSVPEDLVVGSVIARIQADDEDDGPNGVIMYRIAPEHHYLPFLVGESSGMLTLIHELDFETEVIYHLLIKAVDGGWVSKTSMLNLTVAVIDINDNPPVFPSSEYTVFVPENSDIGIKVLDVKANDADSGSNAQLSYSLIAGNVDKFEVDWRSGAVIALDIFDYEQERMFAITIKASNVGGHTLFSLTHVFIQISDVNEAAPTFRKKQYDFSVSKNVPLGTTIGKVTAIDDDQGSEGQVFYLMFGQNKYMGFEINELSGEISTTVSLRNRANSHLVLKVLAKNSGVITGIDVDEALVHITVIDMNDPPVFASALYLARVREDSPVGTSVITLSALDQDSLLDWNSVFFSIENGNTSSSFAINRSTGLVSVNSPLDRELLPVYNLTITAVDNGSPPATGSTNLMVTIDDINDNAPKITVTEALLKENQPQGTIVAKLTASDSDLPPNQGPFTYWLVNPSADSAFYLTPDGVLFTMQTIDREQVSAYQLLVAVRDSGTPKLSSATIFYINIEDENDNPSLPRNIFIEVKYYGVYFQGGMIGKVHPEDQDESDIFSCAIKSGPLHMFTIANGTCELWSSPFQGEATFNVTIEATDGLHLPVNNSIYITYKGFTNGSVHNSIFFYVSLSSMEVFLSRKYLRFVKALDSLFNLQASKTHVFGIKRIGSKILLLAAVKNYNGQYLSREVASGISASHRKLLEAQSNVTISRITSDPCLMSPCQNGATCNKNVHISQDVAVLESTAVIFVSPQKEIFNCTCPAGFKGELCEEDIDECEGNPCENRGTCVNTPGGFYCHCQSGFSGSICSPDVDECLKLNCQNGGTCIHTQDGHHCRCAPEFEGHVCEQVIDHCRSAPCAQGRCVNSHAGFSCHCPFGVSGVFCEEQSYGFEELSFIEFPQLDRRTNLISLEFATVQRNSLLLCSPGGSSSREFFALEILDGAINLSYDLGSGPVKLQTMKQVADGYFHSVTARRIGNMGSVHVDNCTDTENEGFCFSQSDGKNSERTLDVSSNLTVGGLRTFDSILQHSAQIKTHDFVGCIRNIYVNGIQLRPSMALLTYNIIDRCPRDTLSPCHSNPCKNGGMCHDLWSEYFCECRSPFMGHYCGKEMAEELVLRFNGNDFIEYVFKERFKRDYLLKVMLDDEYQENNRAQTQISIKFMTMDNGVLMFLVGRTGYLMLQVNDGKPVYISKETLSGRLSEVTVDAPVADGHWHVLLLSSNGQNTILFLDGELVLNITDQTMAVSPVSVEKIIFGSALTSVTKLQQSGFTGCVQYFNVMGYTLPADMPSVMVDVWLSSTLAQPSCSSLDVCLPAPCSGDDKARKACGPADQNTSCICLLNVTDKVCDICMSTTESHDQCSEAQGSAPLWLMAVILPILPIFVIIGMLAALLRVRRQQTQCQRERSTQKTEPGSENLAFCFDGKSFTGEREKQHDLVCADEQGLNVNLNCNASLSRVQSEPHSELEYYEICSISSASYSDTASVQLSWPSSKCLKAEPKRWRDLRMLLPGLSKESKSMAKPQNVASLNKQLLIKINAKQSQHTLCRYDELQEPVQCLTYEEIRNISKLNNLQEKKKYHHSSPSLESATCSATINSSSYGVTDNPFANMEMLRGELSIIRCRNDRQEQVPLTGSSFRQQGIVPSSPFFQQTRQSAADQVKDDASSSSMFERWENLSNMYIPFASYLPVFEDIARLPCDPSHCYDVQSDKEETI